MDWGSVFYPLPVRGGQVGHDMKLNGFQFCSIALQEISAQLYTFIMQICFDSTHKAMRVFT